MSLNESRRNFRGRGKVGNQDIADALLELLLRTGNGRVADLATRLKVSEVSVRKSLNELEKQGLVCPYRSATTRKRLARLTGRKKRSIVADEAV